MHNRTLGVLVGAAIILAASTAFAEDWSTVPYVTHSTYQAVNSDGTTAYSGGFPVRLIGVVLNNTEDWLDSTPAYTSTYVPYAMGGESEFYIQAINLDGTAWDADPTQAFNDFGGTASWMGQNYGNLPFKADPSFNYTDAEWTAELGRLNLYGGDGVTDPIRAGDLVEIRARAGLHYKGKMNVNEQHNNDAAKDFEIMRLVAGYGLPTATAVSLINVKNADDTFIFDSTRQTGGELYQSTLVELKDVWVSSAVAWDNDTDITVTDGLRTFTVHLGLNSSFDGTELFAAGEHFDVVGVMDQYSTSGTYGTDGYQLLAMNAGDFTLRIVGDANSDDVVNLLDLGIMADNWGATIGVGWAEGDFDGNGEINLLDLGMMADNWGYDATGVGDIPEPASLTLLAMCGVTLLHKRRRRRKA